MFLLGPLRTTALLALLYSIACNALTFASTALVIAADADVAGSASYLLEGYGIAHETFLVPRTNTPLPSLESSSGGGNYGLFLILSEVNVDGESRLTDDQWESLWAYQRKYGVRMVHINVSPSANFGVKLELSSGCCADGVEQNITLVESTATKEFPNAGLKCVFIST